MDFRGLVRMLPVSWENALGMGMGYFIRNQTPDDVKFKVHATDTGDVFGYSIQIRTDKENVKEAKEFWEAYVEDNL